MSGTYKKIVAHKYSKNFREASEIVSTDIVQPGSGQLLIKTHFGGVNASDVNISGGVYFSDGNFPFDLGCESVGEVVAVGPDVTQFQVGDAVASPQMDRS